jgi:hypothetical protein
MVTIRHAVISSTNTAGLVGSLIGASIDRCAWFGLGRGYINMLKILQGAALIPRPFILSEDHWPSHAHPAFTPPQTTCLALQLAACLRRLALWRLPPFHELIPRFRIHQARWPLTP